MGRVTRLFCILGAFSASAAFAQSLVEPERLGAVKAMFDESGPRLRCEVKPIRPYLDYSCRFSAGFIADIPLAQLRGAKNGLDTYLRVKPSSGEPMYLSVHGKMPEVPKSKADAEIVGHFFVGEG